MVKALGDLHKVYEAMEKLRPEHDALYRAALSSSVFADDPLPGIYVEMSMPKAYNPQDGYRYQILCLVPQYERAWEHCDYAADRTEKNYLIGEYRLAYGPSYRFKSILLPQKYWPKKEKAIA